MVIAVAALFCTGCFDKKVEDTPAQRQLLSMETAKLVLAGGTFGVIIDAAVEQGTQVVAARIQGESGRELTKSEYDNVKEAFRESFTRTYPAKDWEGPFAELYEKHFTASELDQLLKFYKTPAGMKFLQSQGTIAAEGAQIGIRLVGSKQEEFTRVFVQKLKRR